MELWDEICDARQEMPENDLFTLDRVIQSLEVALIMWRVSNVDSLQDKREYIVRIIATLVYGIELLDAEIQDEDDAEVTF